MSVAGTMEFGASMASGLRVVLILCADFVSDRVTLEDALFIIETVQGMLRQTRERTGNIT